MDIHTGAGGGPSPPRPGGGEDLGISRSDFSSSLWMLLLSVVISAAVAYFGYFNNNNNKKNRIVGNGGEDHHHHAKKKGKDLKEKIGSVMLQTFPGKLGNEPQQRSSAKVGSATSAITTVTGKKQSPQQMPRNTNAGTVGTSSTKKHLYENKATHHKLYLNVLKGFVGGITNVAIDAQGSRIAVACTDRTLRVFRVDIENSNASDGDVLKSSLQNPTYLRANLEADHLSAIDFSSDGQFIFGALDLPRTLAKFQIETNSEGKPLQRVLLCEKPMQKNTVKWLVSSKGRWIITCSEDDDTEIKVWNYSGDLVAVHDSKQVKVYQCTWSLLDGRFFGVAAWSPGVKIIEVDSKGGEFNRLEKAMDLKSPCGVNAVAFSPDHRRAVMACKDGTLILWNIAVRYSVSEDPKELLRVVESDPLFKVYRFLAFSSDGRRIIGVSDLSIKIMNAEDLEVIDIIPEAHGVTVDTLSVSPKGGYFVTGAADNRPRLWLVPP